MRSMPVSSLPWTTWSSGDGSSGARSSGGRSSGGRSSSGSSGSPANSGGTNSGGGGAGARRAGRRRAAAGGGAARALTGTGGGPAVGASHPLDRHIQAEAAAQHLLEDGLVAARVEALHVPFPREPQGEDPVLQREHAGVAEHHPGHPALLLDRFQDRVPVLPQQPPPARGRGRLPGRRLSGRRLGRLRLGGPGGGRRLGGRRTGGRGGRPGTFGFIGDGSGVRRARG